MESYDVIVVGAGNGGLTAAVTLTQKGLKVLLLERHNIPGGCATSFCRGRFEFEVALHQLSGVGTAENPGPLRMLFEQLGVLKDLELVEMRDLFHIIGPGDFRLALKTDRAAVIAALQEKFPGEKAGIERFFDLSYQYAYQMLSAFYFKDPEPSREKYPVLYHYAYKPAIEVLDELFADPRLKAVISSYWGFLGLPPTRLSFAYLAMLFFMYIEYKPFHLKGGSQALSSALIDRFLSQGGSVHFSCGVDRILLEQGRVRGVVTEGGEKLETRYVVSNASPVTTYTRLLDPEGVPGVVRREMHGRSLSPSAFTLYIGCDCEPEELGITGSMTFLAATTDISDKNLLDMQRLDLGEQFMALSCYDVADPDFSPPGACQISVVTLKYGEPWLRVPPAEYHRVKFRVAEAMLGRVEAAFPEVRAHIEEIEAATPLTHMRYLGHPCGAIYGFEQYTKDSMFFQPGRKSPVPGLSFASGWTGDCGFQPTLEAGAAAARAIIREMDGK
jgi:phytoene dehydrogenase-like protein